MKRIRYTFSIIFMAIIVFGYSPLESTAITLDGVNGQNTIIKTNPEESIDEIKIDENTILSPKYNCDPRILITNMPNIDPHILLKDLP